jgi:hypothetical protein
LVIQATEAIRGGDGPNRETPIIAVTANAMKGDIDKVQRPFEFHSIPLAPRVLAIYLSTSFLMAPAVVRPFLENATAVVLPFVEIARIRPCIALVDSIPHFRDGGAVLRRAAAGYAAAMVTEIIPQVADR